MCIYIYISICMYMYGLYRASMMGGYVSITW